MQLLIPACITPSTRCLPSRAHSPPWPRPQHKGPGGAGGARTSLRAAQGGGGAPPQGMRRLGPAPGGRRGHPPTHRRRRLVESGTRRGEAERARRRRLARRELSPPKQTLGEGRRRHECLRWGAVSARVFLCAVVCVLVRWVGGVCRRRGAARRVSRGLQHAVVVEPVVGRGSQKEVTTVDEFPISINGYTFEGHHPYSLQKYFFDCSHECDGRFSRSQRPRRSHFVTRRAEPPPRRHLRLIAASSKETSRERADVGDTEEEGQCGGR